MRYRYTKSGERVDNITDWALARFRERYGDKPLPFRGGVGVGPVRLTETDARGDSPHPSAATRLLPSPEGEGLEISKDSVFAYVYAVLHDPVYRETYAADLRREFPRVPLHDDFARWADWGRALLGLHIGYEGVEAWPVERVEVGRIEKKPPLTPPRSRGGEQEEPPLTPPRSRGGEQEEPPLPPP